MHAIRRLDMMALLALAGVATSIGVRECQAQCDDAAAAQAIATAYLRALQAADWKAAVGFLELEPFDQYRRQQAQNAKQQQTAPPITAERLMAHDPQMPRAVAEFNARRMNDSRRSMTFLEYQFGLSDPDSVLSLPVEALAERWLEVHDGRYETRRALRGSPCAIDPSTVALPEPHYRVLGTVVSDSVAYVLFTNDELPSHLIDDVSSPFPSMLFLRHSQGSWWVLPHTMMGNAVMVGTSCKPAAKPPQ